MQIAGKRAQIQQFAPLVKKEIPTLSKRGIRKEDGGEDKTAVSCVTLPN